MADLRVTGQSQGSYEANASQRMQNWMKKLQNDNTPEGQALYKAMDKLQTDIKSGTADQTTLDADRKSVQDAMKSFRQAQQAQNGNQVAQGQDAQGPHKAHHHHHHHHKSQATQQASTDGTSSQQATQETDPNAEPGQILSMQA